MKQGIYNRKGVTTRWLTRAINSNFAVTVEPNAQDLLRYGLLHPVESAMPSQTIHFGEELYQFILQTKAENQSTSHRVRELIEAGKRTEDNND